MTACFRSANIKKQQQISDKCLRKIYYEQSMIQLFHINNQQQLMPETKPKRKSPHNSPTSARQISLEKHIKDLKKKISELFPRTLQQQSREQYDIYPQSERKNELKAIVKNNYKHHINDTLKRKHYSLRKENHERIRHSYIGYNCKEHNRSSKIPRVPKSQKSSICFINTNQIATKVQLMNNLSINNPKYNNQCIRQTSRDRMKTEEAHKQKSEEKEENLRFKTQRCQFQEKQEPHTHTIKNSKLKSVSDIFHELNLQSELMKMNSIRVATSRKASDIVSVRPVKLLEKISPRKKNIEQIRNSNLLSLPEQKKMRHKNCMLPLKPTHREIINKSMIREKLKDWQKFHRHYHQHDQSDRKGFDLNGWQQSNAQTSQMKEWEQFDAKIQTQKQLRKSKQKASESQTTAQEQYALQIEPPRQREQYQSQEQEMFMKIKELQKTILS